jgi:hypothetical protein
VSALAIGARAIAPPIAAAANHGATTFVVVFMALSCSLVRPALLVKIVPL